VAENGGEHERFTQAGRFVALQVAARELIEDLVARHLVERIDGVHLDPFAMDEWPGVDSVRLVPPDGAAPLTFAFGEEQFPGVDVHPGHGGLFLLPGCFCDACDEDVHEAIERMRWIAEAVTAGRYSEARIPHLTGRDTYHDVIWGDRESRRTSRSLPASLEETMPKGEADWAPWSPTPERVTAEASAAIREMVWDRAGDSEAFRGEDVRLDGDTVLALVRRSGDGRLLGARLPAPLLPRPGLMYSDVLMRTTHDWTMDLRILLMEQLGTGADERRPRAEHDGWTEIDLWIDPFAAASAEPVGDWRYRPTPSLGDAQKRWGREQPWWRW
jgi:hypothetical protein